MLGAYQENPRMIMLDSDLGNSTGWQTVLNEKMDTIDNIGAAVSNHTVIGPVLGACEALTR